MSDTSNFKRYNITTDEFKPLFSEVYDIEGFTQITIDTSRIVVDNIAVDPDDKKIVVSYWKN